MHPVIEAKLPEIRALCEKLGVRRLELFGSAARDDFDSEKSDIDFLVSYDPDSKVTPANQFFGLLFGLQELLGQRIDLVEKAAVTNPIFIRNVRDNPRHDVYNAAA